MIKRLINCFLLAVPIAAHSMEWDASVSTGLLYTSNAFSDQNASVSEVQRDMSLSADVSHQSKRATIDGGYQVKRAYYSPGMPAQTSTLRIFFSF